MSKYSNFERIEKDKYPTFDPRAVAPLVPFLDGITEYAEPCAGDNSLILNLKNHCPDLVCRFAGDIDPKAEGIVRCDSLLLPPTTLPIITNPPWQRNRDGTGPLHDMIDHFRKIAPFCWLLFDSDWAFTQQSVRFMPFCRQIVAVGRVRWIPGTTDDGKENCSWYKFDRERGPTFFHGRKIDT